MTRAVSETRAMGRTSRRWAAAWMVVVCAGTGAAMTLPRVSQGNPDYVVTFNTLYPESTLTEDTAVIAGSNCFLCHNSNLFFGEWNCYRRDLIGRLRAGRTMSQAMRDIEAWDSDGDGVSNIEEILTPRGDGRIGFNPGLVGPLGTDPCLVEEVDGVPGSTLPVTFRLETPPPPPCRADWDGNGEVEPLDIAAFFADYRAGEADFDGNGETEPLDISAFFTAYRAGC